MSPTPLPTTPAERRAAILRLALIWLGVIVLAAGVAALTKGSLAPTALREWVESRGLAGPLLFLLISIALPLVFVPVGPLTIATGLLFPLPWSILIVVLARNGSAHLGFWLGRRLGWKRVRRLTGHHLEHSARHLRRAGIPGILAMRMLPVAPFTAVSVAAGLSGIRWRHYALGTFAGMLPGSAVTLTAVDLAMR